jgi:hypothetical protein
LNEGTKNDERGARAQNGRGVKKNKEAENKNQGKEMSCGAW